MSISWSGILAVAKKWAVPVLRIVSLGLLGTKAGRVVDAAADVAEVATKVSDGVDPSEVVKDAGAVVSEVKDLIKK